MNRKHFLSICLLALGTTVANAKPLYTVEPSPLGELKVYERLYVHHEWEQLRQDFHKDRPFRGESIAEISYHCDDNGQPKTMKIKTRKESPKNLKDISKKMKLRPANVPTGRGVEYVSLKHNS